MYRAIFVDDEFLTREAVKARMDWNSLGIELKGCFQHGQEALDYILLNPVDIIMTDISMPYMDGLELSRRISEEFPKALIVILSGYDSFDYAKQAMKYKVKEYLLKPFSAQELSDVLKRLVLELNEKQREYQKIVQLKCSYQKNKVFLKSNLLMRLIRGSKTMEHILKELERYQVRLAGNYYCVAVLNVVILPCDREEAELLSFSAYNIAQEIIHSCKMGEALRRMDDQVVVLLAADDRDVLIHKLDSVFHKIIKEIKRCMDLVVSVGIGEVVTITELNNSYQRAEKMLEYEYLWGRGAIFNWNSIRKAVLYQGFKELEAKAFERLKAQGQGRTEEIIEEILQRIRTSWLKREQACLILKGLLDGIGYVLQSVGLVESSAYKSAGEAVDRITESQSLKEAGSIIEEICGQASKAVCELKGHKGLKRAALAVDYIRNHYMDKSLNLQVVCDYMAMSPSRFSAMLKESTGRSFTEQLISIRMEKAEELLTWTDLKNYEIADAVGFSDPHYFSLSFKKITGKTPTEYAREKRAQGEDQ